MSNTLYETNEDFANRVNNYHQEVLNTEKEELPGGKLLKDKFSWDIIRKSAAAAINDVFSHFREVLVNLDLSYTAPEGTSFRISPPVNSFAYASGVRKIIEHSFDENIKNVMSEVYRILTFSQIFNTNNYYN